ncbi:hypothetical protein NST04_30265 [Paenibacillus sp. FSL H7-0756]
MRLFIWHSGRCPLWAIVTDTLGYTKNRGAFVRFFAMLTGKIG